MESSSVSTLRMKLALTGLGRSCRSRPEVNDWDSKCLLFHVFRAKLASPIQKPWQVLGWQRVPQYINDVFNYHLI